MDAQERDLLIRQIARRVQEAGGRAMLVGGCVRDALLCRESGDIDCEVYGLAPDALRAIAGEFGEVDESGARYGVYSLRKQGIDLAVPRLERRTGPLHGDFEVTPDPSLPVERAAHGGLYPPYPSSGRAASRPSTSAWLVWKQETKRTTVWVSS